MIYQKRGTKGSVRFDVGEGVVPVSITWRHGTPPPLPCTRWFVLHQRRQSIQRCMGHTRFRPTTASRDAWGEIRPRRAICTSSPAVHNTRPLYLSPFSCSSLRVNSETRPTWGAAARSRASPRPPESCRTWRPREARRRTGNAPAGRRSRR